MSFIPPVTTVIQGCINSTNEIWRNLFGIIIGSILRISDLASRGFSLYLQLVKSK